MQWTWVWSLVGELGSHTLSGNPPQKKPINNDDKSMTPELEDEHHLLLRNYVSMDQNSGKGESILDLIPQDLSFWSIKKDLFYL